MLVGSQWSNRMCILQLRRCSRSKGFSGGGRRLKVPGCKFQNGVDLFARDAIIFHELVDGRASFEIFKNRGDGNRDKRRFLTERLKQNSGALLRVIRLYETQLFAGAV